MRTRNPSSSLRPALLLLVVIASAVAYGAACSSAQAERIERVRICVQGAIGPKGGECRTDQSRSPIVSPTFYCSGHVRGEAGERFSGRFFYKGQAFQAVGVAATDRRRGVHIYLTAGSGALPGGQWECELRVGPERVRKSFRSGGPTGPILHVAVCRSSRTVAAGPTRVCTADESARSFPATESLTCSAVFVGGKGKLAGLEVLYAGRETGFGQDIELPLPVTAAGLRLDPDPRLRSGTWACRFSVAGRVLAEKEFRIA